MKLGLVSTILLFQFMSAKALTDKLCDKNTGSDLKWRRDPESCTTAYMCVMGRAVSFTCPQGQVIGHNMVCLPAGSETDTCSSSDLQTNTNNSMGKNTCKEGIVALIDSNCAKFSKCSKLPSGETKMVEMECPYPWLFDSETGKCADFRKVECKEGQTVPKNPCEYEANQCKSVHCAPCRYRYPSCRGLPDGRHPWIGKEWSPFYVICQDERIIFSGQCDSDRLNLIVFHPEQRMCVKYDEKEVSNWENFRIISS